MSGSSHPNIVQKVINIIKQLKKTNENDYESDNSMEYFRKIDNTFSEEKAYRMDIAKAMVEFNYPEIALKYLKYYTKKTFLESEQTWPCAFYLLRSIWNYTDVSSEVALACQGFLPILLDYVSSEFLLPTEEEDEKLYKLSLNIMNNIAHQPEAKTLFQQYQTSKILKKMTSVENEHLRVLVYLILAQIVDENEFDKSTDPSSEIIESISTYVKESLKKERRFRGITTAEYMECLAKLAIIKDNKTRIMECGMMCVFRILLQSGIVSEEQNSTLACIWNLCFDEKICDMIKRDKELVSLIMNVKNSGGNTTRTYDEMVQKSNGILFMLNEFYRAPLTPSRISSAKRSSNGPIVISYNSWSRDLCVKIRDELKSRNYPVWIDMDQIYVGSSLSSSISVVAESIQSSSVFLMCVCERYYQSAQCRLEAEYALSLGKPIIPLIMQADYMPSGWLSAAIGAKIYYKFQGSTKMTFEHTFSNMLKEINRYVQPVDPSYNQNVKPSAIRKGSSINSSTTNHTTSTTSTSLMSSANSNNNNSAYACNAYSNNTTNECLTKGFFNNSSADKTIQFEIVKKILTEWTSHEVREWTNSLGLSPWININSVFGNMNGALLKELYEMKLNAPDFFYATLKSKFINVAEKSESGESYRLSDLLKFSHGLSDLFKPK